MMATKRQNRVKQQLFEILSELIQFEVSDPRLDTTSVTDVVIDRELKYATVYIHDLEGDEAEKDVLAGLESARGYLRREVGLRTQLPHVPELRFKWDSTPDIARKIDSLLDNLDLPPEKED